MNRTNIASPRMRYDGNIHNSATGALRPESQLFEPAYYTAKGIVIGLPQANNLAVKTAVMHFQTADTVKIYAVLNNTYNWVTGINNYSKAEILEKLKQGEFYIGTIGLGDPSNLIRRILSYEHDDNSEIHLHYTKPRGYPGNVAWRSINWDLFAEFVSQKEKYN